MVGDHVQHTGLDGLQAPLSLPTACLSTPIATTGVPFTVSLDAGGGIEMGVSSQPTTGPV
jgi:hypothetical protein